MPSGNEVLTAGETWRIIGEDDPSELALRKLTDPTHPKTLKAFNCFIFGLDLHPNGRWHAAAGGGSPTEVRDPESGERLLLLPGEYHHGRFSGDGSHLLASPAEKIGISGARKITVWNVQSGLKVFDVEFPNIEVSGWRGSISHDGQRIITGNKPDGIRIWDVETGDVIQGQPDFIHLQFSPDGLALAGIDRNEILQIIRSGREKVLSLGRVEFGEPFELFPLAFSSNSQWIGAVTPGGAIHAWSGATSEEVFHAPQAGNVGYLEFSREDHWLIAFDYIGNDSALRIWDMDSNWFESVTRSNLGWTSDVERRMVRRS